VIYNGKQADKERNKKTVDKEEIKSEIPAIIFRLGFNRRSLNILKPWG
jgi:hypothetical protein